MSATKGKGAFGVPAQDLDIWVDAPDGVMRQYGGMTRSALSDSRWVSNSGGSAFGWGAFPDDNDPAMEISPSVRGCRFHRHGDGHQQQDAAGAATV